MRRKGGLSGERKRRPARKEKPLALRVLDCTGNGGIWRPVYLTSE